MNKFRVKKMTTKSITMKTKTRRKIITCENQKSRRVPDEVSKQWSKFEVNHQSVTFKNLQFRYL